MLVIVDLFGDAEDVVRSDEAPAPRHEDGLGTRATEQPILALIEVSTLAGGERG